MAERLHLGTLATFGKAVAIKYPTTVAQASGHAEATELAIRASQRPNIGGASGSRPVGTASSRGGSLVGPRRIFQ